MRFGQQRGDDRPDSLPAEELGDSNGDLVKVAFSQLQKKGRQIFRSGR